MRTLWLKSSRVAPGTLSKTNGSGWTCSITCQLCKLTHGECLLCSVSASIKWGQQNYLPHRLTMKITGASIPGMRQAPHVNYIESLIIFMVLD